MSIHRRDRIWRSAAWTALALGLLVLIGGGLAGPGYRVELIELGTAFTLLRWAAYLGVAVAVLAVLALVVALFQRRKGELLHFLAAAVFALAVALPANTLQAAAQGHPPIHDVTTDLADPPSFSALAPRKDEPLRVPARGAELEEMTPKERWRAYHERAYGDLDPLILDMPPRGAITHVRDAAEEMGWRIAELAPNAGRLEATATTPWFGFKDDVVVRVTPAEGGARVDVRSVSRIGISDLGKNAQRIRAFLDTLKARTAKQPS